MGGINSGDIKNKVSNLNCISKDDKNKSPGRQNREEHPDWSASRDSHGHFWEDQENASSYS